MRSRLAADAPVRAQGGAGAALATLLVVVRGSGSAAAPAAAAAAWWGGFRPTARWTVAALAAACALPGAAPASAQVVYAYALQGRSSSPSFESTRGIGLSASFATALPLLVRASLDTRTSQGRRVGRTCRVPGQNIQCTIEPIRSTHRFTSADVVVIPYVHPHERVRLSAGLGALLGVADAASSVMSGRRPDQFVTMTAHAGFVLLAGVEAQPSARWPATVFLEGQARRIALEGCSPYPTEYAPFCGSHWWGEVRLGLGIHL